MLITGKTLVVLLRNEDLLTSVIFCTGAFQCNTQGPIFVDHILSPFLTFRRGIANLNERSARLLSGGISGL